MRTGRPKAELVLSDAERSQLQSFARSRSLPAALSSRARIVLSSAEGDLAPVLCSSWPKIYAAFLRCAACQRCSYCIGLT